VLAPAFGALVLAIYSALEIEYLTHRLESASALGVEGLGLRG
jgi:hypothetical protein